MVFKQKKILVEQIMQQVHHLILMLLLERVLTRALQSFLETMKVKLWQLQQSFIRVAEALALRCCIEDLLSLLSESSLDIS